MARLFTSFYNQKWYIESVIENPDQYLYLFDNIEDNRFTTTTTNNGVQQYLSDIDNKKVSQSVQPYVNFLLKQFNAPVRAGKSDKSWIIKYNPGGWQAMHNHALQNEVITCIIYLDTNYDENTSAGALYACLPEPDGSQILNVLPYWKGKLVIIEGSVYHGAYPTSTERKCLIIDFQQELLNDTN